MKRCDGGRGLIGVADCVQAEANSLDKYLSASEEKMLKEVSLSSTLENKKHGKRKEDIQKKSRGVLEQLIAWPVSKSYRESKGNKSLDWLEKGYLKEETESTIIAAQDQALCTRIMRKTVYGENVD